MSQFRTRREIIGAARRTGASEADRVAVTFLMAVRGLLLVGLLTLTVLIAVRFD